MGMFDDIIVPKSYLRGLLTKKQEKLIKNNDYQTKCLENALFQYKLHSRKLYINKKTGWTMESEPAPEKPTYEFVSYTGSVNFYNLIRDERGDCYWVEFCFTFDNGVLDKKELVKFEMQETAEEAKEREKTWRKRHAERDAFQRTFKYKFFDKIRVFLTRILEWVQQQTRMPDPNSVKVDRQRVAKKREKLSFWKDY
tara:strand:- start:91 stop:681 length:591 start_codon:yes stop_codon:yes gene_type:complete